MEDANFEELLIKYTSWTIDFGVLIEIYESLNHISPPIMQEFFDLKVTTYSLRNNNLPRLPKTNTSRYGTQALYFEGRQIWNTVPNRYQNLNSLDKFKQQIKMWKPVTCTCKLYKAC